MPLWGFLKRGAESESRNDNDNEEETIDTDGSLEEDSQSDVDQDKGCAVAGDAKMDEDAIPVPDSYPDQCSQHVDELIRYYCPIHDSLGCGVCVMIDHRNCEGVVYIPKVADEFQDSSEFKEFAKELNNLKEKSEKIMTSSKENIPKAANNYKEALQTMDRFRQEKISTLDQMEKDLKTKAATCRDENTEKMNTLLEKTSTTQEQVDKMLTTVDTLVKEKQLCRLYIEMKAGKHEISTIRDALEKLEEENFITYYKPSPGKRKLDLLDGLDDESPGTSGEEFVQDRKKLKAARKLTDTKNKKPQHVSDVYIKSETDKSVVCMVEGLVVLPGNRLVVTDKNNSKVKLVDTMENKIIAELTVPSAPLGVTGISEKQVAVALKSELAPKCDKLLILRVGRTLKAERLLKSSILFEGDIAFNKDKFLVIQDNGCQVQALDMVGSAQKVDFEGFSFGSFVAVSVSPDKHFVYIASVEHQENCEEGYLMRKTKLDADMNCLQAVQNVVYSDLFKMHHGADQTGRMFILGPTSISVMDEEGSEPSVLLTQENGIYSPKALTYDQDTKKLYVSMCNNNYLKVFKIA